VDGPIRGAVREGVPPARAAHQQELGGRLTRTAQHPLLEVPAPAGPEDAVRLRLRPVGPHEREGGPPPRGDGEVEFRPHELAVVGEDGLAHDQRLGRRAAHEEGRPEAPRGEGDGEVDPRHHRLRHRLGRHGHRDIPEVGVGRRHAPQPELVDHLADGARDL
jgi:hypothetical protein